MLKFKKVYNHNLYEAKKLIKNYDLEKNYLYHKNLYLDVIEKNKFFLISLKKCLIIELKIIKIKK